MCLWWCMAGGDRYPNVQLWEQTERDIARGWQMRFSWGTGEIMASQKVKNHKRTALVLALVTAIVVEWSQAESGRFNPHITNSGPDNMNARKSLTWESSPVSTIHPIWHEHISSVMRNLLINQSFVALRTCTSSSWITCWLLRYTQWK